MRRTQHAVAGFEDGGMRLQAKEWGWHSEAGRVKKMDSSLQPAEGTQASWHLHLSSVRPILDCKRNMCCFKSLSLWQFVTETNVPIQGNRMIKNASLSTSLHRKRSLFFGTQLEQLFFWETFQNYYGWDRILFFSFFALTVLSTGPWLCIMTHVVMCMEAGHPSRFVCRARIFHPHSQPPEVSEGVEWGPQDLDPTLS